MTHSVQKSSSPQVAQDQEKKGSNDETDKGILSTPISSPASSTLSSSSKRIESKSCTTMDNAENESLELLEWSLVCRQVACFCQTPMGAERAMKGRLPIGRSLEESKVLYQQAREAAQAQDCLHFEGLYDLRQALRAAESGSILHPLVLGAVTKTLASAVHVRNILKDRGETASALQYVSRGIETGLPNLRHKINASVDPSEGRLRDDASQLLLDIRTKRKINKENLRRTADKWARSLHASGLAERAQVVIRRDRLCVPVKAGRQTELPSGSVVLASSASKNTVYVEPTEMIPLNNDESRLSSEQLEEEERILSGISKLVAKNARPIRRLLRAIENLDLACARARHAAWLHGIEPRLINIDNMHTIQQGEDIVHLEGVLHPLLLERALSKPPSPPLLESSVTTLAKEGPMAAISLVPELLWELAPQDEKSNRRSDASPAKQAGSTDSSIANDGGREPSVGFPMEVDFLVSSGISVVAITGPNTGGKTVALKTLGLLSIMAKAGVFIPVKPDHQVIDDWSLAQLGSVDTAADMSQCIGWFDRVLVDIGDGQSLQQSLSTFSGHVRRLCGVLQEATPSSLVLLDEVGSGTDPVEGAALAVALLTHMSEGRAALTLATSHHAEVKEMAFAHPKFLNVSVEFDVESLQPTYRLCWGSAGESNALNIARGLNFDDEIVSDAENVLDKLRKASSKVSVDGEEGSSLDVEGVQHSVELQKSLESQLERARSEAARSRSRRARKDDEVKSLERRLQAASDRLEAVKKTARDVTAAVEKAEREIDGIVDDVVAGRLTVEAAGDKLQDMLRRYEKKSRNSQSDDRELVVSMTDESSIEGSGRSETVGKRWRPEVGSKVAILKMGGAIGEVLFVNENSGKLKVRIGSLTLDLNESDISLPSKRFRSGGNSRSTTSTSNRKHTKVVDLAAAKRRLRAGNAKRSNTTVASSVSGVAVQTPRNTITLVGLRVDDAETVLRAQLETAPAGSVLFVVHGVGTGRVRQAVMDSLNRWKATGEVEQWQEAEGSNGGCTVVWVGDKS